MKKIFSILMCFTILISTLVFTQIYISAEESTIKVSGEFKYEVIKDGTASILSYSNNHISNHGTTLKIPSTIDNYVVSTIGFSSFIADYSITSLVIPDSVKYIGGHAFRECYNLQNVTMGNSIEIIYSQAFSKCSSLTSITIPNSVKTIRDGAFGGCTNLKSVNYIGTEEEWKKIDIEEANKYLINAELEFTPSTSAEQTQPSTKSTTPTVNNNVNTKVSSDAPISPAPIVIAKKSINTPKVKFTAGKKQIKIKYTKVKNAVGFQVRYRIKGKWKIKNFTTKKSVTKVIKKLKKGKYKIQIRSFTKGKKQFSKWTKVKTVKVK